MIKRLISDFGGVDEDSEVFLCFLLPDILRDRTRAKRAFTVVFRKTCGGRDLLIDLI